MLGGAARARRLASRSAPPGAAASAGATTTSTSIATSTSTTSGNWQHDPAHRGGVRYNNANVAQKFGKGDRAAARSSGWTSAAAAASRWSSRGDRGAIGRRRRSRRDRQARAIVGRWRSRRGGRSPRAATVPGARRPQAAATARAPATAGGDRPGAGDRGGAAARRRREAAGQRSTTAAPRWRTRDRGRASMGGGQRRRCAHGGGGGFRRRRRRIPRRRRRRIPRRRRRRRRRWRRRRRRSALGYRVEARHRAARHARQRPWLLSLRLQRQRQGLCRRDGAGGADGHARCGRARPRRVSAGPLRQARPEVPDLRSMDRIGRAHSAAASAAAPGEWRRA